MPDVYYERIAVAIVLLGSFATFGAFLASWVLAFWHAAVPVGALWTPLA